MPLKLPAVNSIRALGRRQSLAVELFPDRNQEGFEPMNRCVPPPIPHAILALPWIALSNQSDARQWQAAAQIIGTPICFYCSEEQLSSFGPGYAPAILAEWTNSAEPPLYVVDCGDATGWAQACIGMYLDAVPGTALFSGLLLDPGACSPLAVERLISVIQTSRAAASIGLWDRCNRKPIRSLAIPANASPGFYQEILLSAETSSAILSGCP